MFAIWLKNHTLTQALGNTMPYEWLYKTKPNLSRVPEWGQKVWVHSPGGSKLNVQAIEGHWVGFDYDSMHTYHVYWLGQQCVMVERDLKFVPTTVTVYSLIASVPHMSLQVQHQPSHALGAPPPITPPVPLTPTPTPTGMQLGATDSGEDEMPDEEEEEEQIPSTSTLASSTPTFVPESLHSGHTLTQPPGAPKKSKISPFSFQTRCSTRLAEKEQTQRATTSTWPATLQTSTSTQKHHMPGGLPIFQGTHPNYIEPGLPEDKASLADVKFDSEDEDEDDDKPEVKLVKVNIHVMVMDAMQDEEGNPKMLHEAKAHVDWPRWKEAMDHEIATLDWAQMWITVLCLEGKNIVGSKWVFRIKRKADRTIEKYKARLVACGFTQVFGEDYYNTFSPVAKLQSFQAILVLAVRFDWEIE